MSPDATRHLPRPGDLRPGGHAQRPMGRRYPLPVATPPRRLPDAGPRRVAVVLNPVRPRARQAQDLIAAHAREHGWPAPIVLPTSELEPGGPQARLALARGVDQVVVVGGDGTLREVAHVLADADHEGRNPVPVTLGVVPVGTANLFARNLLVPPRNLRLAVRIALTGPVASVDAGWAQVTSGSRTRTETFLVVAGIGRDALTLARVSPTLKRRLGWAAYFGPALSTALARSTAMTLEADDAAPDQVDAWCILFANCGRIPGGIRFVEGAVVDDGRLDTLLVSPRFRRQWVGIGVKGLFDLSRPVPGLSQSSAGHVVITPRSPQYVQFDGDLCREVTRLEVRSLPQALTVRVPDLASRTAATELP